jgi:hypothetical protein
MTAWELGVKEAQMSLNKKVQDAVQETRSTRAQADADQESAYVEVEDAIQEMYPTVAVRVTKGKRAGSMRIECRSTKVK